MHNIRSTFPLDEAAITRAALRQVAVDPITWVPFVPVMGAYTFFDVPGLFAALLGGGVATGLTYFWRGQWEALTRQFRRQAILEHNAAQNALLLNGAGELRRAGAVPDALQLEQFLALKKQVEQRLHADGTITEQKMQLEQLVDSLCFGVRDQLASLMAHQRSQQTEERKAIRARVANALETLQTTAAEIDTILGTTGLPEEASTVSLDEVTRRLHEEAEIARRIRARLHAPESPSFSPAPELPGTSAPEPYPHLKA